MEDVAQKGARLESPSELTRLHSTQRRGAVGHLQWTQTRKGEEIAARMEPQRYTGQKASLQKPGTQDPDFASIMGSCMPHHFYCMPKWRLEMRLGAKQMTDKCEREIIVGFFSLKDWAQSAFCVCKSNYVSTKVLKSVCQLFWFVCPQVINGRKIRLVIKKEKRKELYVLCTSQLKCEWNLQSYSVARSYENWEKMNKHTEGLGIFLPHQDEPLHRVLHDNNEEWQCWISFHMYFSKEYMKMEWMSLISSL